MYELANVRLYDAFLLAEGFGAETRREPFSLLSVLFWVSGRCDVGVPASYAVVERAFQEIGSVFANVTVDFGPGFDVREGKFVGGNADDIAVLAVQLGSDPRPFSTQLPYYVPVLQ